MWCQKSSSTYSRNAIFPFELEFEFQWRAQVKSKEYFHTNININQQENTEQKKWTNTNLYKTTQQTKEISRQRINESDKYSWCTMCKWTHHSLSRFRHKNLIYSIISNLFVVFLCVRFVVGGFHRCDSILLVVWKRLEGIVCLCVCVCVEINSATHFLNWYLCILLPSCNYFFFLFAWVCALAHTHTFIQRQLKNIVHSGPTAIQNNTQHRKRYGLRTPKEEVKKKSKTTKSVINKFSNRFKNTFVVYCISLKFSCSIRRHRIRSCCIVCALCNQLGICQWNN